MADDIDFMKIIGNLGTLVGLGSSLKSIFDGPQSLTIADIQAAVLQEMQQALLQQSEDAAIVDGMASVQAAQDFLKINYLAAQNANQTKEQLWTTLTDATAAPSLSGMDKTVSALQLWIDNSSDPRVAANGIPVCLALYTYMALIYRERAAVSPDGPEADTTTMRTYARTGVTKIGKRLNDVMTARLNSLTYISNDDPSVYGRRHTPDGVQSRRASQFCTIDSLHDAWFEGKGQNWLFAFKDNRDPSMDYADALHWVQRATRNLLWSGSQADADDLWRSLTDGWLRPPGSTSDWNFDDYVDDFRGLTYTSNLKFGQWAQNARALLATLDAIAFGFHGTEQADWAWCSDCGGLFFTAAKSVCPKSHGPHVRDRGSADYVLRCDPVAATPPHMSDNWRWCNKCGVLFKDWGTRACPAGGAHDPSGSGAYVLDISPVPDASARGLDGAQPDWRWCGKCSALHFSQGASVCPIGGAHDTTGSEDYWLGFIGPIPMNP